MIPEVGIEGCLYECVYMMEVQLYAVYDRFFFLYRGRALTLPLSLGSELATVNLRRPYDQLNQRLHKMCDREFLLTRLPCQHLWLSISA